MARDLVIAQVRRNRAALARELGSCVEQMVAELSRRERASGMQTVSLPPKRVRASKGRGGAGGRGRTKRS